MIQMDTTFHNEAPLGSGGIKQEYTFTLQTKASA